MGFDLSFGNCCSEAELDSNSAVLIVEAGFSEVTAST